MDVAFENSEISRNTKLSGNSYVPAKLKGEAERPSPIVISTQKMCGHTNRICVECASSWEIDYIILWERTIGGRKLKAEIDAAAEKK